MIFNRWKKYPKRKPKEEGWYQCVVEYGVNGSAPAVPIVMDLFWWNAPDRGGIWVDRKRQRVFDGYKVFLPCRAAIDENRVYTDSLCERIDVIAWKRMPVIPRRWKRREKNEMGR